jgi:muconolactone delta-isomerase
MGLARRGKMVRLSRSAGNWRAVVVMAMINDETQINVRLSSLSQLTIWGLLKKLTDPARPVIRTVRMNRT